MHFPVIIELYSLSASMYSTEGAPTLSLHLRPVWTDQLAFCDFTIRKILSASWYIHETLSLPQSDHLIQSPDQNL